ncbi:DUF1776-domain-containing protein [Microthyrium microscopicum]|uniref:DUF1776-domain-containing protein n=1 Tax=Microthyrium microscopicum TaxID=703497 RepID=A0A6A6USG8_9PEZI|nr:DUF1776-domain-containing protein [Microthyrium microscopicum]
MSSGDQHHLNSLDRASESVRSFVVNDIWEYGKAAEKTATQIVRESIHQVNQVLGVSIPIPDLPKPKSSPQLLLTPKAGFFNSSQDWIVRNKTKSAIFFAVVSASAVYAVYYYNQRASKRKTRRAKRSKQGARKEVVVIIGTPGSAVVRSISLDLEKRGFIVYIIAISHDDITTIQSESRPDIKPLRLEIDDPFQTEAAIQQFHSILDSRHQSFPGATPHTLDLTGVVIAPDLTYHQLKRIDSIAADVWTDEFSTKVTLTINASGAFLPLVIEHQARVLILTPTITYSLSPPLHAVETTMVGALEGYTRALQRELHSSGVHVSHLKLGAFDFGALTPRAQQVRASDSRKYANPCELHHKVFDALTMKRPFGTSSVGSGSVLYGIIGSLPTTLVDLMISKSQLKDRMRTALYKLH